jgi:perosamine synthetase
MLPNSNQKLLSYGRQCLDADDIAAVSDVLHSDWLTQGPVVPRFEEALSARFGSKHAVACSSGTAALHLAAASLEWGPGDIIIVPAITFLATANCCAYVGAEPFFVDIDENDLTIDPNDVERHVKKLRASGKNVRGVIGVDMAGHPCDWRALREIANRYELDLVDDACHAMGASYRNGIAVGSCTDADITLLSFHPVKHITTGEGGVVLTNDPKISDRAFRLRSHGTRKGKDEVEEWEGPWHYDMTELGYNFRLTDIQCALGLSQLPKLDRFVEQRRCSADRYHQLLAGAEVRFTTEHPEAVHSYHLMVARLNFASIGKTRLQLFDACRALGIILQVHYRPVVFNSYYAKREINAGADARIPVSKKYYSEAVSLPMFPQLTEEDMARVVAALRSFLD